MPTHIRYNNHTGAQVACVPNVHAQACDRIGVNSINTLNSKHNESMDLKQPTNFNLKDRGCSRRHLIPSQIFLTAIIFVAVHFSSCSCVFCCSMTASEEKALISNTHDFSVVAISGSDDACGLTVGSSDDHSHDKILVQGFEDDTPLVALLGMDWEMSAPLLSEKFSSYYTNEFEAHNQMLTSAGTGMILHPSYYENNQKWCTLPSKQQFENHQCSKLDSALLSQCTLNDHDQETNKSNYVCPLQNSKYLHLYNCYTIGTMKGLLLSDDIIEIITHQKMLQIRPKYFALVIWLMIIGLTFSYYNIISGTSYDIGHRDNQRSQSGINSQSSAGSMDSDSNNNIVVQTCLPSNFRNHCAHMVHPCDTTSESESDLEPFFPPPIPVATISTTNHDHDESPTYSEANARVVINPMNQLLPFIHQFGATPSPDTLMEDYPSPIQETQQSKSIMA